MNFMSFASQSDASWEHNLIMFQPLQEREQVSPIDWNMQQQTMLAFLAAPFATATATAVEVVNPHRCDVVLFGHGSRHDNPGNERFRLSVCIYSEEYRKLDHHERKYDMAKKIVDDLARMIPPSRFVEEGTNQNQTTIYTRFSFDDAVQFTQQALRASQLNPCCGITEALVSLLSLNEMLVKELYNNMMNQNVITEASTNGVLPSAASVMDSTSSTKLVQFETSESIKVSPSTWKPSTPLASPLINGVGMYAIPNSVPTLAADPSLVYHEQSNHVVHQPHQNGECLAQNSAEPVPVAHEDRDGVCLVTPPLQEPEEIPKVRKNLTGMGKLQGKTQRQMRATAEVQISSPVTLQHCDVLFGRGSVPFRRPANKRFRLLVKLFRAEFESSPTGVRRKIAQRIVDALMNMNPPARFVAMQEENKCVSLPVDVAVTKTMQSLREKRSNLLLCISDALAALESLNRELANVTEETTESASL